MTLFKRLRNLLSLGLIKDMEETEQAIRKKSEPWTDRPVVDRFRPRRDAS